MQVNYILNAILLFICKLILLIDNLFSGRGANMSLGDHLEENIKLRKISKYYKQYSEEQLGMCTTHIDNVRLIVLKCIL